MKNEEPGYNPPPVKHIKKPLADKYIIRKGTFEVDLIKDRIYVYDGPEKKEIHFTQIEFKMMKMLILNKMVTRKAFASDAFNLNYVDYRTVNVHITRIRKKLGVYANSIKTIFNEGYKLEEINNE